MGSHFGFRFLHFAPVATRMSKGKSVSWETLPWGDPSRRALVRMSNGESVSRETLSCGDLAIGWPAMDALSGVSVFWERCPRGRVSLGRLFSGEIFSAGLRPGRVFEGEMSNGECPWGDSSGEISLEKVPWDTFDVNGLWVSKALGWIFHLVTCGVRLRCL